MGGNMGRLQNKISIVSGAGSGIGRGIALLFAKEGARVVVADIGVETGEETVGLIKGRGWGSNIPAGRCLQGRGC